MALRLSAAPTHFTTAPLDRARVSRVSSAVMSFSGTAMVVSAATSTYSQLSSLSVAIWTAALAHFLEFKALLWQQLQNDFIGGSLMLAIASAAVGALWRTLHTIRRWIHDRVFSTYELPQGTPQYFAALRQGFAYSGLLPDPPPSKPFILFQSHPPPQPLSCLHRH